MALRILLVVLSLTFLTNCAAKKDYIRLEKASFSQLTNWSHDQHSKGLETFIKSCSRGKKILSAEIFSKAPKQVIQSQWAQTCKLAKQTKHPKQFFEDNFTPYLVKDKKGYCSPFL